MYCIIWLILIQLAYLALCFHAHINCIEVMAQDNKGILNHQYLFLTVARQNIVILMHNYFHSDEI